MQNTSNKKIFAYDRLYKLVNPDLTNHNSFSLIMAKNVILIIGDGMGWEMSRASAIYNQVKIEIDGLIKSGKTPAEITTTFSTRTLDSYYTSGKGTGTPYQSFEGYQLATTGSTYIDGSTNNSALQGSTSTHNTGDAPVRPGFNFDPSLNYVNFLQSKGGDLPWDSDYYADRGKTSAGFDPEYIKKDYPDSANTASTLYGAEKTYNGAISVDIHERGFETILEQAKAQNKSGGVVTSVPINHATPAAAISHVNSRNKYQESSNAGKFGIDGHPLDLIDNILDDILFIGKPQVVLGGGNPAGGETYVNKATIAALVAGTYQESEQKITGKDAAGKDIITTAPIGKTVSNERWKVVARPDNYTDANKDKTGLEILEAAVTAFDPEKGQLMGIYGAKGQGGNLPWRTADSDYSATGTGAYADNSNTTSTNTALSGAALAAELKQNPTVAQLTEQALKALGKDKDGFWLMVEVGDIDWAAHATNMDLLLGTQQDINDVTNTVTKWVEANGGWSQNQVMVTADHDHYLTLLPNYPKEVAESILLGIAAGATGTNEATTGINTGYDTSLNPTLTKSGTSQWKAGDAEKVGHFWGTTTKLADTTPTTGIGDGWWTHTQRPVPVYYKGEGSEIVDLFVSTGIEAYGTVIKGIPGLIDQAHVANAMNSILLGGSTAEARLLNAQESVVSPVVSFTSVNDNLIAANNEAQLTFKSNTIFTGAGEDTVDSSLNKGFQNTIFTGSGADTVYSSNADVVTGGSGNDSLYAEAGNNNRLSGGAGNDTIYIGSTGNRALGGDGADIINIGGEAGTNYLNGGAGADQFWLVSGAKDLPAAKQFVMDFTPSEDKVGLRGYAFADLSFTQAGSDTLLTIGTTAVGHFNNISAAALNNQNNFAF